MQVLQEPVTPPRQLDRKIDRDLELICLKCLERDPEQRYASSAGLADDLENWLAGKPISVRPPTLRSLGLLNAVVTRPANIRKALQLGISTALICAMFFSVVLGWVWLVGWTAEAARDRVGESVGKVVWPPSPEGSQDAEQEVLKLAPGLNSIPEEERAELFARKLFADLLAGGPLLLLGWAVLMLLGMVPIVYGTVAAHVLLAR